MKKNKKKIMKREVIIITDKIPFIISTILFFIATFLLGVNVSYFFNDYSTPLIHSNSNELISNITQCSNLSLSDTSVCLRDYVKTFYNYTIRSDILRTLEDIQINGGDCYDYSLLYINMAKQLGFNAKQIIIYGEDMGHSITVISDSKMSGYCILDQINVVGCIKLEKDSNSGGLNSKVNRFITSFPINT